MPLDNPSGINLGPTWGPNCAPDGEEIMLRNRVVVADDQTTFSERLRGELEPDFKAVASVRDGRSLVQACDLLSPDIVICDAEVPFLPGLDAVEELRADRFEGVVRALKQ